MNVIPKNYKRTKYACCFSYPAMASAFCLPSLLFVTFHEMYGISYTLLGTLVLINFCTQLTIDLIFSFFSKYFNIAKTVCIMPLLTFLGLVIYATVPLLFPGYAYIGLVVGTVIFSVSAGLSEVLISPIVAAIPAENPEKEMSMLHSVYAYGVVMVVVISTLFFRLFGTDKWMYLTLFLALFPLLSSLFFALSPIPDINFSESNGKGRCNKKSKGFLLCLACIFLGGASEATMTNWISSYIENATQIPKAWGDILGMALFAILLGLGRSLYAKYGKNIAKILLLSMIGATVCYLIAGLSPSTVLSLFACVLTGLCTAMLWPGTLLLMEKKYPAPGVAAYALMAAGGDFGASVAPQTLGVVVDHVSASEWAVRLGDIRGMSVEQIGMKIGMLTAALFPLVGIWVLIRLQKEKH